MIAIIDYGMGNLHSVFKTFKRIGADVVVSSNIEEIEKASKIVLPGVGHFASGVANLKSRGLWEVVNKEKEHIFGVQFHPEKSHDAGLQLLKNFVNL